MSQHSTIEWTNATWNPITGCSVVSPGCTNCYAMRLSGGRLKHHPSRKGLTRDSKAGPVWTGEVRFNEQWLTQPLKWAKPFMVFVCAHGDLFHESVSDEWIDKIFAVMALAPQHTFQVLTKRAERMRQYFAERWQPAPAQRLVFSKRDAIDMPAEKEGADRESQVEFAIEEVLRDYGLEKQFVDPENEAHWTPEGSAKCKQFKWPLPNVWLGVSAEDQARADERIPELIKTPAAVRFVSLEPLLGPIMLWHYDEEHGAMRGPGVKLSGGVTPSTPDNPPEGYDDSQPWLDWVIVGGESGPNARPTMIEWVRSLRHQCAGYDVPFFFKQWGEFRPDDPTANRTAMVRVGKSRAGRLLDGVEHSAFPASGISSVDRTVTPPLS